MKRKIIVHALTNAGVTASYIILIATFLSNIQNIFGDRVPEDTILAPIIMLLLLVISASITGFAVFGRPIMWYLDGNKKDSVSLLATTIGFLTLIALFFITILL